MRTVILITAALVISAVATAATTAPRLSLVQRQPPLVAGAGFVPAERVTVTAITLYGPKIVRVTASASGSFRARFARTDDECGAPVAFRARGVSGRTAWLRLASVRCVPPPIR